MAVNSSRSTTGKRWIQLPCLPSILFLVLFIIYVLLLACSATQISYSDQCASIVPELSPTVREFITLPFSHIPNGYCLGGDRIINQNFSHYSANFSKVLTFQAQNLYRTEVESVFKVEGSLNLLSRNMYYSKGDSGGRQSSYSQVLPPSSWVGSVNFKLRGFWSKSSGKLCMVGSGSAYSKEGNCLNLAAVLKLNNVKNSSTVTDLFSGTLESLDVAGDSNYFEPISILVFPQMNYHYTLISEARDSGFPEEPNVPESSSLTAGSIWNIYSVLSRPSNWFELEYAHDCNSSQNCTPFGGVVGYLPRIIATKGIQYSEVRQRLQLLIKFQNISEVEYYRPFNPKTTLVGEGWWDMKKNRLSIIACRILNSSNSLANARVGDCSVRLSLRFPEIWTIRKRSSMVGQIWSNRTVNDSEYFRRIMFQSSESIMMEFPGLKYEYTEIDRARKSCQKKKPVENMEGRLPDGNSFDMQFDMSVKRLAGVIAWGSSAPLFVGDKIYDPLVGFSIAPSNSMSEDSSFEANRRHIRLVNISYKISFKLEPGAAFGGIITPFSSTLGMFVQVEISAEGIYDAKTRELCMVGCRKLSSGIQRSVNDSMDCEVRLNLQFPSLNSKNEIYIKGSIESMRERSHPLYFEPLDLSSTAFTMAEARKSIWRMDWEIIMVLLSNTLACAFASQQLFHVKKQPNVLPSISLIMLVILTLGHVITLVSVPNALFLGIHGQENILLDISGWLKVNNAFVTLVTVVVFLLQFCLLQLTLSSRLGYGNQEVLWAGERNVLYVALPLYLAGFLISWFLNWRKNKMPFSQLVNYQQNSLWWELGSYAGMVVDSFLFPQILLNMFVNSRENILSPSFYVGTTLIRLLPHAYDLYRAHNYAPGFGGSYIYANPSGGFYSTSWDVIVLCGCLFLSTIIFLQQRFGGCCILPRRFRKLEAYEKIPVSSDEQ